MPLDLPSGIRDELSRTKLQLFRNPNGKRRAAGFLARLMTQVDFQWTDKFPTAAISPKVLYWNPDFFLKLDKETRVTVLAHELWHNGLLHSVRIGNRCPDIWNIAGDHVINLLLKEHGFYMDGFPYCMDDKYIGWTTEEVYDDLINSGLPMPQPMGTPMTSGQSDPGDGDEDPQGGWSQDGTPMMQDVIVTHKDDEKTTADAIRDILSAATTARMTCKPGEVPGEVDMVLDEFLNPRLPWNTILFQYFNSMVEDSYSYMRPNRRYDDPLLPGLVGRDGLDHLVFASDISGSITDENIIRFFSEGREIQQNLEPEAMTFVTFDTEVHDIFRFERGDDFSTFNITGRGGTDLNDLYAFATKESATALVIFTDLHVNIPDDPGFPVIWICTDNPDATVPYGKLIHFSEETGYRFG